jgi:hypothetical protein
MLAHALGNGDNCMCYNKVSRFVRPRELWPEYLVVAGFPVQTTKVLAEDHHILYLIAYELRTSSKFRLIAGSRDRMTFGSLAREPKLDNYRNL